MIRIVIGVLLLLFFLLGLLSSSRDQLTNFIIGGGIILVTPSILLIYFGWRAYKSGPSSKKRFSIESDEKWIRSGYFIHHKSLLNARYCYGHLTSKRFVVCMLSSFLYNLLSLFGVLGLVIMRRLQPDLISFEIPLNNISSIKDESSGLIAKTRKLTIKTEENQEYTLIFRDDKDQWVYDIAQSVKDVEFQRTPTLAS